MKTKICFICKRFELRATVSVFYIFVSRGHKHANREKINKIADDKNCCKQ